jgi:hypothetical protein
MVIPFVSFNKTMDTRSLLRKALAILMLASPAWASFGFKFDGSLDKDAISHAYFEGEFSRVLPPLETYRQSFPANATRDDSIFVYKYLSVIYAADPSTRKKAESYMIQLVKLMPTIELIDMYISDNIEAIFRNVKANFLQQQQYVREHDIYGKPVDNPGKGQPTGPGEDKPSAAIGAGKSRAWIWWTVGALGTAAIATTVYVAMSGETTHRNVDIKP